ncbi:hypothetical protein AVEN_178112-1 [Araneus ventricosus]|uniref:Uncharacterized protein n=1 Tax=Araneus ventricosus TaxID=182803 RepID=A0A4Y2SVE9_ARAVE|nr:hypothetical protein AVEN_178112-1 [Araneus ventricosus]
MKRSISTHACLSKTSSASKTNVLSSPFLVERVGDPKRNEVCTLKMNPRFECRSDSKPRVSQNRNTYGRTSLQNENPLFKSRRSSSADRARSSGGIPKPRSHSEERKSLLCK